MYVISDIWIVEYDYRLLIFAVLFYSFSIHQTTLSIIFLSFSLSFSLSLLWLEFTAANTFACVVLCSHFHINFYLLMLISESFSWMDWNDESFCCCLLFYCSILFWNTNETNVRCVKFRLFVRLYTQSLVCLNHTYERFA